MPPINRLVAVSRWCIDKATTCSVPTIGVVRDKVALMQWITTGARGPRARDDVDRRVTAC
jgi:hypothetical protein